jgi:flagellar biosynthetic protein FlhB
MEVARRRMMQEVPEADVVVTNPVHLAVAIKYDRAVMNAPHVIAKGAELVAEKIKALAIEHNIPVVENKPLAQSLYKAVEVGEEVPMDFYQTVAEVLAYVYKVKGKVA